MPSYTLPPEADVVEGLVTIYRGAVPRDLGRPDRSDNSDDAYIMAEMIAIAECATKNWNRMGVVTHADGAYLELQARQVGLFKQVNESDSALRTRIRTPPLAITPDLILQAIQQIVDAAGGGLVFMIEIPRDAAYVNRSFANRGYRIGGASMIIVLIPASANCLSACTDALRAKRAAGKLYRVEEYS